MKHLLLLLVMAGVCLAQAQAPAAKMSDAEQEDLRRAVSEGSTSTVDLIRALEGHLAKYPNSPRKIEIERAITKAAIDTKDEKRIATYGQRVISREPDDLATLDRVIRALLNVGEPEGLKKAVELAKHYQKLLLDLADKSTGSGAEVAKRKDDIEKALARAIVSEGVATGNLGNVEAAAELARKSFRTVPSVDAAAELGRRLGQLGKNEEAVQAFADAFTIPDSNVTEADRANIRRRMGELYQKVKGSEAGLGDVVLKAYDRNAALQADRRLALRQFDPNTGMTNPMDFTLTGVNGEALQLKNLAGKAVVLDFWATWCGPCRAQHPLYEEVKKRFAKRDDVVFLAVTTDDDHELVKPFLAAQGWAANKVYFEDGLSKALRVTSIPTTVVFGRTGVIVSRMNGFDPDRFVDMLTERINDALK